MELKDFIVTPIVILLIYAIALKLRNKDLNDTLKKYYTYGLSFKIFSGIFFALIYTYYYSGGDTTAFFEGGKIVNMFVGLYPFSTLKFMFSPFLETETEVYRAISIYSYIFRGVSSLTVIRIIAVINIFTFKSFFATTVVFAAISFSGLWKLFLTLNRIFPTLHKTFAVAIFFIPSVAFWGSGISKDALVLGAVGWMTYAFISLFYFKEKRLSSILILLFFYGLVSNVRGFVNMFLILSLSLIPFFSYATRIKNPFLRKFVTPFALVFGLVAGLAISNAVGSGMGTYSVDSLASRAEDFQKWHSYLQEHYGGSGYSIGEVDFSTFGMIKSFIPAVNVSLFRPYLWEAYSIVILLSALESLMLFVYSIRVFFKNGFKNAVATIFSHPIALFCFAFTILYAFAVGLTSNNFGALVRYKIPCIPFYLCFLGIVDYLNSERKLSELEATEK